MARSATEEIRKIQFFFLICVFGNWGVLGAMVMPYRPPHQIPLASVGGRAVSRSETHVYVFVGIKTAPVKHLSKFYFEGR